MGAPLYTSQDADLTKAHNALGEPFLGQVAAGCQLPWSFLSASKQSQSRSRHEMLDSVERFKVVYSWGTIRTPYFEISANSDAQIRLSVEYPVGVFTRVKFNKSDIGRIPDLGHLESDWIDVPIPMNGEFFLWPWTSATGGVVFSPFKQCADMGEFYAAGVTTADHSDGSSFTSTDTTSILRPSAIIAYTRKGSVLIISDSRQYGANTSPSDMPDAATKGRTGTVERCIGDTVPIINCGRQGDAAKSFRATNKWRMALAKYATSAIYEPAFNDIFAGRSAANVAADRNAFLSVLPANMPAYLMTMTPKTATTDNWKTLGNQTIPTPSAETIRETENTARRAVPLGFSGCFDVAAVVETAITGGKGWPVNGTDYYATGDGTHETKVLNELIRASGAIDAALLLAIKRRPTSAPVVPLVDVLKQFAAYTLTAEQSGLIITNEGAASQISYTLPSCIPARYTFIVQDADGVRIVAQTGHTIRVGASVSASGGNIASTTIGDSVTVVGINETQWVATSYNGTWTVT